MIEGIDKDTEELKRAVSVWTRTRDFPFSLFPVSPWRVGAGLFAGLLLLLGGVDYFFHDPAAATSVIGGFEYVVISFLIAYVMVANEHGRERFVEEMLTLSPVLRTTQSEQLAVFEGQAKWRLKGRLIGGLLLNLMALPFLVPLFLREDISTGSMASLLIGVFLLQFVAGNALYDMFDLHSRILSLTKKGFAIDLLDLSPLDSFGRLGLATAGKVAFGCAIAVPLMLDSDATLVTGSIVAVMILIGLAVLVLPTRTVRVAVRAEKEKVLADVNERIRHEYQQNKGDYDIAGLIAYREMVRGVHEWPLSIPMLLRFLGVGVVPILSWFAAAFIDQIVDRFVG